MTVAHTARAVARGVPRGLLVLAGTWVLVASTLAAQGGRSLLWRFSLSDEHRFTSMAILTGTLRLRNSLSTVQADEQVFGGAGYTNWGFGVPLLQAPFHAVARWLHVRGQRPQDFSSDFFPDRAIFFAYLLAMVPVLWLTFNHVLEERQRGGWLRKNGLSWAATWLVLTVALFPLMSSRFLRYEETICYFMLFELLATCAYMFALSSQALLPLVALACAAGVGVLIRPTGVIYLGMWSALVLLERRTRGALVAFAAAAAPFVVAALCLNRTKAASPFSFGYENGLPWLPFHTAMQRFDNYQCANTWRHALQASRQLFEWFFVSSTETAVPYLQTCHFAHEVRPPQRTTDPVFGMPVLAILVWVGLHHVARRERRLSLYVPFAVFLFIFLLYVRTVGFTWRYAGDFWPLVVLVAVRYVRWLPPATSAVVGLRLALVMVLIGVGVFRRDVKPAVWTITALEAGGESHLDADFRRARTGTDPPLPSRMACESPLPWPFHNGQGWESGCAVDTFTNVFLGVPRKAGDHYQLKLATEGFVATSLRVYVDGRIYLAKRSGNGYLADLRIDYGSLHTPAVMATVEWTSGLDPVAGKLLSIELA